MKSIMPYILPVVSGCLAVFSFPSFDLSFLAWIAFFPLLLSVWENNRSEAFLKGFVFGVVFFCGTLYWIYHSIFHYGHLPFVASAAAVLLLCCYLALYPALFAAILSMLATKSKLPSLLLAPLLWVTTEFIRSYALSGFPWSSIGYSQYNSLFLIQIADITGVYGISFIVLAVNGAVFDLFVLKKRIKQMPLFPVSYTIVGLFSLIAVLALVAGYGYWRLEQDRPARSVNISIIQGNIAQDKKWEPSYQNAVLEKYMSLSRGASTMAPDLIIWPETSLPFFFNYDQALTERFIDFQKNLGAYLLFGSVLVKEQAAEKNQVANSAVLLNTDGVVTYIYDKIHLVPFGEYVPLRSLLFFIDKLVRDVGDYKAGDHYLKADTPFGSFATLICYEIIFPGMVRKFYSSGGDFMVTITNDAWFGKTAGPFQHFSMGVFRAVENRKPLVRAANTGVSGIISSNGQIFVTTPLFTESVLSGTIHCDRTLTVYSKYGDIFSFLCILISLILYINIVFRR